jgi:2-oxoisovalerate dehydrogenase E1 component
MTITAAQTSDPTTSATYAQIYAQMLEIRTVEERVLELRRLDQIAGSVHTCVGQEVVPAAVASLLDDRDRISSTYRGHGWAIASGIPTEAVIAEIMGKATGINGGRGGSAYMNSYEHGFIGENSIVGAGTPIAVGVAMGLVAAGTGGVSVVSIGDGATNQGAVHEAIVFAIARRLPVIFVCENNTWSEMTPISETVPNTSLAERAQGYGMAADSVQGNDIDAVLAVSAAAIARARAGEGPTFLEIHVPRLLGHYNADIEHYRTEEDRAAHRARDPLAALASHMRRRDLITAEGLAEIHRQVESKVAAAEAAAVAAPTPDPATAAEHVISVSTGNTQGALPVTGTEMAYGLAVNKALIEEMAARPNLISFGEDIGVAGGTFGVTRNIQKQFGSDRIFDTPISEAAILGGALGASLEGLIPVVEIMWSDFLLVAFDQIVNQFANVRYISEGKASSPVTIRMQQGITPGSCAQHSQSLEALIAHIPGIKVGLASNAHDAYMMTRAAIADPDPVVVIESRALYLGTAMVDASLPVESVGGARVHREGSDITIISWGRMVNLVREAADRLAGEGIEATVLDLRWLNPLDEAAIVRAVEATGGKVMVVHEANLTGGFGAEIAARLVDSHFHLLDGPVRRVALPDVRVPSSPALSGVLMPDVDQICTVAREVRAF